MEGRVSATNKAHREGSRQLRSMVHSFQREVRKLVKSGHYATVACNHPRGPILDKRCFLKRALYPNVIIRILGIASGSRSFNHMTFVSLCVQVSIESPFKPCIATKLCDESTLFTDFCRITCPPRVNLSYLSYLHGYSIRHRLSGV